MERSHTVDDRQELTQNEDEDPKDEDPKDEDPKDQDPESRSRRYWILCDPFRNVHRFVVLIFMCFLSFGNYFCYDNAAALEDNIMQDMDITASRYGLLYTVYSWPNVILAFLGGFLMDRVFGLRLGAIIFATFIMIGQVVFACGALANSFKWMIVGRFIFAIGGESLAVAQNTYAVKWFKGKELNTVFGVQLSFGRVGSTVNMYVMKPLYNQLSRFGSGSTVLGFTLLIGGASTTIFSWLCSLILWIFDKRYDRIMDERKRIEATANPNRVDEDPIPDEDPVVDVIQARDILRFPFTFWLLCVVCVAYYVAIFPFVAFGLVFFESKYQMDAYDADICNSLIYLISIGASPIFGALVDYTGRNVFWIIISVIFTALAHGLLAFAFVTPYVPMVIIGLSYSLLAASLWPCVAFVVEPKALGTAYGVMQSIQNLGLALLYLSVGAVVQTKGYLMLELYFLLWLNVALCCAIGLWFVDALRGGILNMTKEERQNLLDEIKEKNQ